MSDIAKFIRTIPNYPKQGIMFRDITTLLKHPEGFKTTIELFRAQFQSAAIDYIVGIEARGFIIGSALAYSMGVGFVPVRKKGKLPGPTHSQRYELEYGSDEIEIHTDALVAGAKVLIVDDLIATGGTALGALALMDKVGANVVGMAFVVDLPELGGSQKIQGRGSQVFSLCEFSDT